MLPCKRILFEGIRNNFYENVGLVDLKLNYVVGKVKVKK